MITRGKYFSYCNSICILFGLEPIERNELLVCEYLPIDCSGSLSIEISTFAKP